MLISFFKPDFLPTFIRKANTLISASRISKSYGSFPVLDITDLQWQKGLYWIKGTNGSGKSTLLKILAGLLPFKGDIIINNQYSIHKHPVAYRALVNHAPAEPQYPSFLTGQQLVDFYLHVKKGTQSTVAEVKQSLGIDNYLSNPIGTYSSGMLKKLSLLLAFIGQPAWILLDEPFTTLDVPSQIALQKLIQAQTDAGVIFTSHHDVDTETLPLTGIFTIRDKKLLP
ncbi:MAG: ATP-binding cassette domain-containing protein [Niabella sp.]